MHVIFESFCHEAPRIYHLSCMMLICHYNDDRHVISTKTQCQDVIDRHCFNQDCVPNED